MYEWLPLIIVLLVSAAFVIAADRNIRDLERQRARSQWHKDYAIGRAEWEQQRTLRMHAMDRAANEQREPKFVEIPPKGDV